MWWFQSCIDPKQLLLEKNIDAGNGTSGNDISIVHVQIWEFVLDSAGLSNLLSLFPDLSTALDTTFRNAVDRVTKPGFHYLKEKVVIAEALFGDIPGLTKEERDKFVALIKRAGSSKELKENLRDLPQEPSSVWTKFKSFFSSKEQIPAYIEDATFQIGSMTDKEFLVALQEKVFKEPILNQLVQDVVAEARGHIQESMEKALSRLYSQAHDIKQQVMYHQAQVEANNQDQQRRASARLDWINDIKKFQAHADQGYVL